MFGQRPWNALLFHFSFFLLPDLVSRQKLPVTGACRGTTSARRLQSRVATKSLSILFSSSFCSSTTYFHSRDEPFLFVRHCRNQKKWVRGRLYIVRVPISAIFQMRHALSLTPLSFLSVGSVAILSSEIRTSLSP